MKALISSIVVFSMVVAGIVWYEYEINLQREYIEKIVSEAEKAIFDRDLEKVKDCARKLDQRWESLQKTLMMFNDHKDINEMSQALTLFKSFSDYGDYMEMYSQLENFKLLFDYSVKSSKPTPANIL